jgi:hypothetical protein
VTELQKNTGLTFPSVWYEGMPMTIIEVSVGTPIIAEAAQRKRGNALSLTTLFVTGMNRLNKS